VLAQYNKTVRDNFVYLTKCSSNEFA